MNGISSFIQADEYEHGMSLESLTELVPSGTSTLVTDLFQINHFL